MGDRRTRPVATISVDVDPVDLHLTGYGYVTTGPDPLVYTRALPRLLELFERCGVRATFFVVARDAAAHAPLLAAVTTAGHEVASHTLTHPIGLASMPADALRRELTESRLLLEDAARTPVVGFRSPQFDMNGRTLEMLAETGYAYDASACPTPMLVTGRLVQFLRPRRSGTHRLEVLPFTWRREPHVCRRNGRAVYEFPLSVTPIARDPLHHSLRYRMPDWRFGLRLRGFAWRGESIVYLMHAVDALGLREDDVDRRLARYTGMSRPLEKKLALLERTLRAVTATFESLPLRERLEAA